VSLKFQAAQHHQAYIVVSSCEANVAWSQSELFLRHINPQKLSITVGPKNKQPYSFCMQDDSVYAFAGLWKRWQEPGGEAVHTCTILTTKPNSLVATVHDRMPVVLNPEYYDLWLDPGVTDPARVSDCLKPFEAGLMRKYPASTRVNHPDNDDPECAKEASIADVPQTLF
jgi:putative SOS response-associated peptidase YedK